MLSKRKKDNVKGYTGHNSILTTLWKRGYRIIGCCQGLRTSRDRGLAQRLSETLGAVGNTFCIAIKEFTIICVFYIRSI